MTFSLLCVFLVVPAIKPTNNQQPPQHRHPVTTTKLKHNQGDSIRQRSLLHEFSRVQAARLESRRRRAQAACDAALEARRGALIEKEELEARHLRQQQELKAIQIAIKKEEEALAAVRREEIRRRAGEMDWLLSWLVG